VPTTTSRADLKLKVGSSTYDFLDESTLVIAYTNKGATGIIIYDSISKSVTELPLDIVHVDFNSIRAVSPTSFAVIGGTTKTPPALYLVDITRPSEKQILRSSTSIDLPLDIFSPSRSITFPRTHGTDLSRPSYAIFVPPHNPDFEAPKGSLPPLILNIHGGPTGHVPPALRLDAQYFTSRGYAFAHVNYAGSSGFGRAYRDDLNYSK
jgi:dipeptidyl aminopeptidase/acylaminoacyl peptidase